MATLWSDTWLSIFLLWWLALIIEMRQDSLTRWGSIWRAASALLLVALVMLVRYNALYSIRSWPFFWPCLRRYVLNGSIRIGLIACFVRAGSFLGAAYAAHDIGAVILSGLCTLLTWPA